MAPYLADDDAFRQFLATHEPPAARVKARPSNASRCLRRWFEGAPDADLFFLLALLERHGPQPPSVLVSLFAEAGATDAEALEDLSNPTGKTEVSVADLCARPALGSSNSAAGARGCRAESPRDRVAAGATRSVRGTGSRRGASAGRVAAAPRVPRESPRDRLPQLPRGASAGRFLRDRPVLATTWSVPPAGAVARSPNLLVAVVATKVAERGRPALENAFRRREINGHADADRLAKALKEGLGLRYSKREANAVIRRVADHPTRCRLGELMAALETRLTMLTGCGTAAVPWWDLAPPVVAPEAPSGGGDGRCAKVLAWRPSVGDEHAKRSGLGAIAPPAGAAAASRDVRREEGVAAAPRGRVDVRGAESLDAAAHPRARVVAAAPRPHDAERRTKRVPGGAGDSTARNRRVGRAAAGVPALAPETFKNCPDGGRDGRAARRGPLPAREGRRLHETDAGAMGRGRLPGRARALRVVEARPGAVR